MCSTTFNAFKVLIFVIRVASSDIKIYLGLTIATRIKRFTLVRDGQV